MNQNISQVETRKRLDLVNGIQHYIIKSKLTGLLVTGSLAWGKDYSVTQDSDIDFYVIGPKKKTIINLIEDIPCINKESLLMGKQMLEHASEPIDTVSFKTHIGQYHGSVYFFDENSISNLTNNFLSDRSVFFNNLRLSDKPQTKVYKSFYGENVEFTTPVRSTTNTVFFIRTDPVVLNIRNIFYGSIFLSHLLYGDIYCDKNQVLTQCKEKSRVFLRSLMSIDQDLAYKQFLAYLPRVERMTQETIQKIFNWIYYNDQNSSPTEL